MKKKLVVVVALAMVVAMLCLVLTACVPSIDKAEENLKEAGYIVSVDKADEADKYGVVASLKGVKGSLGTDGIDGEYIEVRWFDSADSAKKVMDELSEADRKELEEKGFIVKRDGKVVYFGTEQAIKDMK